MIRIIVTDRNKIRSSEIGAHLLREIYSRHPKQFKWQQGAGIEELSGSRELRNAVEKGRVDSLLAKWRSESTSFRRSAEGDLLY